MTGGGALSARKIDGMLTGMGLPTPTVEVGVGVSASRDGFEVVAPSVGYQPFAVRIVDRARRTCSGRALVGLRQLRDFARATAPGPLIDLDPPKVGDLRLREVERPAAMVADWQDAGGVAVWDDGDRPTFDEFEGWWRALAAHTSGDMCRPVLDAVHFANGKTTATNSYSLVCADPPRPFATGVDGLLVAARPLGWLVKAAAKAGARATKKRDAGRVSMRADGDTVTVEVDAGQVSVAAQFDVVDGEYPDWAPVVPDDLVLSATISDPERFAAWTNAAAADDIPVVFDRTTATVTAGEHTYPGEVLFGPGWPRNLSQIGFDPVRVTDAVSTCGAEPTAVSLAAGAGDDDRGSAMSPGVFTRLGVERFAGPGRNVLLMPVHLDTWRQR